MKRIDLLRYLEANGCILLREGGKHSVYCNPKMRQTSTVPRHNEIKNPYSGTYLQGSGNPEALKEVQGT